MPLIPADATSHLSLFAGLLVLAFATGVYGHIAGSRTLIILAIVVIGLISLYFVEVGEVASFNK